MSHFLESLAEAIVRLRLGGSRILIGVSGGADSVALLRGLHALAAKCQLDLRAAHLNHGLRPGAADEDARWTEDLCNRLGVAAVVERSDVQLRASTDGLNIEEAARNVRYEFLERVARRLGCTDVAVAHNADDQVETVLHHLLRGTGLAGMRGMRPARPLAEGIVLVRPLLSIRRTAIETWLAEQRQDFCVDATNADQGRTRNRIRHVVLPTLEREAGTHVRESLLRLADQAADLQEVIERLANDLLESCIEDVSEKQCRLNVRPLANEPRHLVREVFVALWKRQNWPRRGMGFYDWDRIHRLVKEGGAATLPGGIEATRRGSLIVLSRR
jgi:tRNA(Ile)-lysidine synthase